MGIDVNLLERDIRNLMKYMSYGPSDRKTYDNISSFNSLNSLYSSLTGKYFNQASVLPPDNNFEDRIKDHNYRVAKSYLFDVDMYLDYFIQIFSNYNDMLDNEKFICFDSYGNMTKYNEKELREILLDFFSKMGETQYKIVKKYFDENRIELGSSLLYNEDDGMSSGVYYHSTYLKSGYVVTCDDEINVRLMATLAHEFGHALDFETFIFTQQKKMKPYGDFYLEIPSALYELLFFDYLKKNKIETNVSDLLLNDRIAFLGVSQDYLEAFKYADYFDIDLQGNVVTSDDEVIYLNDSILYGIGYYYAFHLRYLYENMNKQDFWKLYYNLLSCRKEASFDTMISTLGISPEDFVSCKYIRPTVASNVKTLKKRYNME